MTTREQLVAMGRQWGKSLSVYDVSSLYPSSIKIRWTDIWRAKRDRDEKQWWKRITG